MATRTSPANISIGAPVRVLLLHHHGPSNKRSCRATISTLNYDDRDDAITSPSVDVVYDGEAGGEWSDGKEEESHVPITRLLSLLPFEKEEENDKKGASLHLREHGNELFRLGDYGAALHWYKRAFQALAPLDPSGVQIGRYYEQFDSLI